MTEASNSSSPSGMWQVAQRLSDDLWTAAWLLTRGEVHIVVAGTAGRPLGLVNQFIAWLAVPSWQVWQLFSLLWERDVGEVVDGLPVSDDYVGLASLDAWEVRTGVNLMNHHLKVDGIAGIGICCLRGVAGDTTGSFRLDPPWSASGSWHLLQVSVLTTSRI